MELVLRASEMKEIDQNTSDKFGLDAAILMERAALQMADIIEERFPKDFSVGILCGPGNNGADGVCLARILFLRKHAVRFYVSARLDSCSDLMKMQIEIAGKYGLLPEKAVLNLSSSRILVDALFGIGQNRPLEGQYLLDYQALSDFAGIRIACDIPTGVDADTGQLLGFCIPQDITITFAYRKMGQLLYPGRSICGELLVADVGIYEDESIQRKVRCSLLEESDLPGLLPKRRADSNKGTYGKVLDIAGSGTISGAAVLSAKAALRVGAGYVRLYSDERNRNILATSFPEAIIHGYRAEEVDYSVLTNLMQDADAILIGPGIGTDKTAYSILKHVCKYAKDRPLVIDADGLNILSEHEELLENLPVNTVLTPHMGELSRLMKLSIPEIKAHAVEYALHFSKRYKTVLVMKDATSLICGQSGNVLVNTYGNSGMATAGSGDVLAGIISGLMAQGRDPMNAASLGVLLHALSGDMAARKKSEYAILASDILDGMTDVLLNIEK